jgi:hypothetical protein
MGMGEKTQIHIQIDKDEKEDVWEEYAEDDPENPNDSLTFLIKRAVNKEINSDRKDNAANIDGADIDLSEITTGQATTHKRIAELQDAVDDITTTVESVERAVTSDTQKQPLEERLYEALPPAKPGTERHARAEDRARGPRTKANYAVAWDGTLAELCVRVREGPDKVEDKLDEMNVPRKEIDGELRYWMETQI